MRFSTITVLASFLVASSLAAPLSPSGSDAPLSRREVDDPYWATERREVNDPYWAKAERREVNDPYWAKAERREVDDPYWATEKRDGTTSNCVHTTKGVFCTYSSEEVAAYDAAHPEASWNLSPNCFGTKEQGILCAYHL